ncbi:MAG: 50S ribosomal protein L18 [Planctomycetota bacterium]
MSASQQKRLNKQTTRRRYRVRRRIKGTAERPRLTVRRSNKHIYCQLIDDETGKTLASASTRDKGLRTGKYSGNVESAAAIGKAVAERAAAEGIKSACFDRGIYKFHGRVKALADAAREAGLQV